MYRWQRCTDDTDGTNGYWVLVIGTSVTYTLVDTDGSVTTYGLVQVGLCDYLCFCKHRQLDVHR